MLDHENADADELVAQASPGFAEWLADQNAALMFSTNRAGMLLTVSVDRAGELRISAAQFDRVTGIALAGKSLFVATQDQILHFIAQVDAEDDAGTTCHNFTPHSAWNTGDLAVRDVAVNAAGQLVFISSRFNCLATVSENADFQPLWLPKFINRLVGEDRCHLNGIAVVDGRPRFATACSQTNYADGWRNHRRDGGVLIDIEADEAIIDRLSMPHSPRWYRNRLWILNAGMGSFGVVDFSADRFDEVAFCPGFARGLTFIGDYAIVGISQSRHDPTFDGLPLKQRLLDHNQTIRRGVAVFNLQIGRLSHWLWLCDPISELFDVLVLPGIKSQIVTAPLIRQRTRLMFRIVLDGTGSTQ